MSSSARTSTPCPSRRCRGQRVGYHDDDRARAHAAAQPAALPVRFVAFGAEEARGGNGTRYAFGSRHFVGSLSASGRRAVRGMVSLDRVGVRADTVPVCSGGRGTASLATAIRGASRAAGVATNGCTNRASDHVSSRRPAYRRCAWSVPYAGYHSARDVPSVVDPRQLERVGATSGRGCGRWAETEGGAGRAFGRMGP